MDKEYDSPRIEVACQDSEPTFGAIMGRAGEQQAAAAVRWKVQSLYSVDLHLVFHRPIFLQALELQEMARLSFECREHGSTRPTIWELEDAQLEDARIRFQTLAMRMKKSS